MVLAILVVVFLGTVTVGSLVVLLLGNLFGFDMAHFGAGTAVLETATQRNQLRLIAGCNQVFTFLLPATLLAAIVYKGRAMRILHLDKWPSVRQTGIGILLMMASFPVAQMLYRWNSQLPLPEWMIQQEDSINELISALLVADGPSELFANLLLIGLIPALGEELLFRGILQRELSRWTSSGVAAVWITAILFSAIHLQFQGFFPRLALGAVLGFLYLWTGNLWVSVLAHFVNNGFQVLLQYVTQTDVSQLNPEEAPPMPWWLVLASVALLIGLAMQLIADRRRQQERQVDHHSPSG